MLTFIQELSLKLWVPESMFTVIFALQEQLGATQWKEMTDDNKLADQGNFIMEKQPRILKIDDEKISENVPITN